MEDPHRRNFFGVVMAERRTAPEYPKASMVRDTYFDWVVFIKDDPSFLADTTHEGEDVVDGHLGSEQILQPT